MRRRVLHAALLAASATLATGAAALPPQQAAAPRTAPVAAVRQSLAALTPMGESVVDGHGAQTAAPTPPATAVVHLTFDDGPDPTWTPLVLDALRRHNARATFFVVGRNARLEPELVARIRREGHGIANHTWSHPPLVALSDDAVRGQLARTDAVVGRTVCGRPPYGAVNQRVDRVLRKAGYHPILWDVDTEDWRRPGRAVIARRITAGASPGAVILLHDGGGDRSQTAAALDSALTTITAKGYAVTPLRQCVT